MGLTMGIRDENSDVSKLDKIKRLSSQHWVEIHNSKDRL